MGTLLAIRGRDKNASTNCCLQFGKSFGISSDTFSTELVLTGNRCYGHTQGVRKAFSYLRVSGKGQIKGDGFTRQRIAIKSHAATHDCKIIREFREEGVRGSVETMDRPAWAGNDGDVALEWRPNDHR